MIKFVSAFGKKDFEDQQVLKKIEEIFIQKRGYTFKMPQAESPVILLLSGGMDSVIIYHVLLKKYRFHVYPLYISNQGLWDSQQGRIKFFTKAFKKDYPLLFHEPYIIKDKALKYIDKKDVKNDLLTIVKNLVYSKEKDRYRVSYIGTPLRQIRFAFYAYNYAISLKYKKHLNINTIFCGVVADDTSVTRESTLTKLRSTNLNICLELGDFRWQFTGALEKKANFFYDKHKLIQYAKQNKIPLEYTWGCDHNNFPIHCGKCAHCIGRKQTFRELGLKDRTTYLPSWLTDRLINVRDELNIIKQGHQKYLGENTKTSKIVEIDYTKAKLSISPQIDWQKIDDIVYVFDKNKATIERLNPTASFIFTEINQNNSKLTKIINAIANNFQADEKEVKKDTINFIIKAVGKGYLNVN